MITHPNFQDGPARLQWRVLLPLLLVLALMAVGAVGSIKALGAVRAFVGGESLWSKARSEATRHLSDYATSRDPQDYAAFEKDLSVIEGDHIALSTMRSAEPDSRLATEGLMVGGNHPDDIGNMVSMFEHFGDRWLFADALQAWSRGDELIDQLRELGQSLQAEHSGAVSRDSVSGALLHIQQLNAKLLANEKEFSRILADMARLTEKALITSIASMAVILALLSVWMVRRALQRQNLQQRLLAEANERWELAVNCAELGLYELDLSTQRFSLDAQSARLHWLPPQPCEKSRDEIRELLRTEDRQRAQQIMDEAIASGRVFKSTYHLDGPDGQSRLIESTGRLDLRRQDHGARVIGVVRDVTEEHARAQLAIQRDAAQKIAESQRAFLSRLSHELRTPLNAILGFAQLLGLHGSQTMSTTQQQQVQWILSAGRQLLSLVEDVLDLSKVEAGHINMKLQPVDLAATLDEVLPLLDGVRAQHEVMWVNQVEGQTGLLVMADPQRLQQVFINLISNACKYNLRGGRVRIEAHRQAERVRVSITDNGIGLSEADAAALFQPFKRIQSVSNQHIEGTGLGLYIVRQLVEHMGGDVSVSSQLGVGSRFEVCLRAA